MNEFNVGVGEVSYLPLVSGLLRAYAETFSQLKENYQFMPFIYRMALPAEILANYTDPPDVAAFSSVMWNAQLNYHIAAEVKRRWPECLIVFGGPNVPMPPQHSVVDWMQEHRFIDVGVRAEGEESFADILSRLLESRDFRDIPGVVCRYENEPIFCGKERPFKRDLSELPSPYLEGLYDELIASGAKYQAIIETSRGCPFPCSFCVAEGTKIVTPNGERFIEQITPGEAVLGWDEDAERLVWNVVDESICTGKKSVLALNVGGRTIEVTVDHRVYTRGGWRKAGEIKSGEDILVRAYEAEQPYEETGSGKADGGYLKEAACFGGNSTFYVHAKGSQDYESDGEGKTVWAKQPYERSGGAQAYGGYAETSPFSKNFSLHDGSESYEEFSEQKKSSRSFERSFGKREVCKELQCGEGITSKWFRNKSVGFSSKVSAAVSLYRRFQLLDRTLSFWVLQEPRLYSREKRSQKGYFGTWDLLAQGPESRRGIGGLQESQLGVLYNLGYRTFGSYFSKKNQGICWEKVASIHNVGMRRVFDLVNAFPSHNFFANGILVHNCYWGRGGLSRKFKYHDLERVFGEVEWMGRNGIRYLFNADSNFGMNKRDGEIADYVVATKKKWGAPEKFRTCFGKNTDDKIFEIGALLHGADMEKGITLARQSNNLKVLENIQRQNIKMSTYVNLQKRFNDRNIPVYCELILGLPGETVESWKAGMDELIEAGTRNQIFAYLCQVFDNTELAEMAYRERFKIVTKRLKLTEIHCTVRPAEWVTEYEDIVVSTYSMTTDEWRAMVRFSYVMMLLHSLKIGYYLMIHLLDEYKSRMSEFLDFISSRKFTVTAPLISGVLDLYDAVIDGMLDRGEQRGTVLWDYGDFYWDMEEVAFLRLTQSRGVGWNLDVYAELDDIAIEFIGNALTSERLDRLTEVMLYQRLRIPSQSQLALPEPETRRYEFKHNIPEYFDKFFGTDQVPLMATPQSAVFTYSNHSGDRCQFARETILWGRKSGTMLVPCRYGDL